jgi:hypothetical protein
MTGYRNRQSGFKNRLRRVCATAIVVMMTAPTTGCSASDFLGVLFLSLGCAFGAVGTDGCIDVRLAHAAALYQDAYNSCNVFHESCNYPFCQLKAQLRELKDEECSNQQDHWQVSTTPGGAKPPFQCKLGEGVQDALRNSESLACP